MNKEAYEFLNSARAIHYQWLRLKSKRDELESCLLPAAIRYDKDKVQSSPEDTLSKVVAEVVELEKDMDRLQIQKAERIEEIDNVINDLDSDEERTALMMRFVSRIPVKDIADAMGYAEPTVYKFLNQGGDHILKSISNINANVR